MLRASIVWVVVVSALAIGAPTAAAGVVLDPVWIVQFDVGGFDLAQDVSMSPGGDIYVTGTSTRNGDQDAVVMRLHANGAEAWRRTYHATTEDASAAVLADDAGALVAGSIPTAMGGDALVHRYDVDGNVAWTARFDKGTKEVSRDLALAPDGGFYLAGVSLSQHGTDGFLARFDAGGAETWSRAVNVFFVDEAFAVASDPSGDAYVAGRVVRDGSFDVLLRKYSADGATLWTRYLSTDRHEEARGVAATAERACVSGTRAEGEPSQHDLLVACFDESGKLLWERTYDVTGSDDEGRSAAFDASGNLLVTGFGSFGDAKSPFLLKLEPDGEELWRHVGVNPGLAGTGSISVSPDGSRILVAGAAQREGTDFDYLLLSFDQGRVAAAFRAPSDVVQAGQRVTFEDATVATGSPIASWAWDFGDGAGSTAQNPTHVYAEGGTYVVTLVTRDAFGNVGTATRTLVAEGLLGDGLLPGAVPDGEAASESAQESPASGFAVLLVATALALVLLRTWRR